MLNIISNVAGSISTVVSNTLSTGYSTTPAINAISITTSGNSATATGYSDTAGTTSLGTVNTTNTGQKGDGVGIIMTPGGYSQGTTVGPFKAN